MKKRAFLFFLILGFLLGPIFPGPLSPALATITDTYTPVQLTADGVETDFDFDFKVFNNTDLVVAIVDPDTLEATTQTLGTDYTVAISTSTAGGTVTFGTAPTDGDYVSISRNIPITQTTDIPSGGLFRERQIENALDKSILVSQQLKEFQDRSIAQNLYATPISELTLPLPSAGKGLKWNDTENGFENSENDLDEVVTDVQAAQAAAEAAQGLAETAQGLAETARDAAQNYAAALKATSTSSVVIGTGSKTFTIESGKQFAAGQYVLVVDSALSSNYMHGQVTSYSGTTLVIDVQDVGGSGTIASWNIYVSGTRGEQGEVGTLTVATAAGTVDAITADFDPDISLADKAIVAVVASGANTSTTPTFAPDGLTAHTIVKQGGSALLAGDIPAAGFVMLLEYNLAGTRWELLNAGKTALPNGTTAITQSANDNSTKVATTAYVDAKSSIAEENWTSYKSTSSITGWTGTIAGYINYKKLGKTVFVNFDLGGTSDSTSVEFTLPYASVETSFYSSGTGVDNGASTRILIQMNSGSVVQCIKGDTYSSGSWTASGSKIARGTFWYQTT